MGTPLRLPQPRLFARAVDARNTANGKLDVTTVRLLRVTLCEGGMVFECYECYACACVAKGWS